MRPFLCLDAVSAIYCAQEQEVPHRILTERRSLAENAETRRSGEVGHDEEVHIGGCVGYCVDGVRRNRDERARCATWVLESCRYLL